MALEQLRLASGPVDGVNGGGADDGSRAPRLPRWTRQEILVLIQGKRVAENRVRRGRVGGFGFGSGQMEPKWASVSGYCKRHGVNRGPVQCRKRWSNLAGDYKKIKEYENQLRDDGESFWVMRNDLRREKKLPGFFDREVYDILDGASSSPATAPELELALTPAAEEVVVEEEEDEVVFDSGRSGGNEDGLFSDFEQSGQDEGDRSPDKDSVQVKDGLSAPAVPSPIPISEKQYHPFSSGVFGQATEKQAARNPETGTTSNETRKRKHSANTTDVDGDGDGDGDTISLQAQLIRVLERNGSMVSSQLEAQNTNFELDREQRKDHVNSLVSVLNKLADALGRIADKL